MMSTGDKVRDVLLVGVGIAGLLFSRFYAGEQQDLFHSFGANVAFSFGAYFFMKFFRLPPRNIPYASAAYTLLGVSAQEIAQATGLYPGWYDPLDFLFNGLGIALALGVDLLSARIKPVGETSTPASAT